MSTSVSVKPKCLKCGNNPTNHMVSVIDSALFLWLNPFTQWFYRSAAGRLTLRIVDLIFNIMLRLGTRAGFMFFTRLPTDYTSDRALVMAQEAVARGYTFEVLSVFGRFHDTFKITTLDKAPLIFSGVPRLDQVKAITAGWMDDKWLLKQRLLEQGIPVSRGRSVNSLAEAKRVFTTLTKPVIVKPRFGSRGRHTTTHIRTEADLVRAYQSARQLGIRVLVEEHLFGSVYRATCINGKLAGVLAGDPPRITGDGSSTIAVLIDKKNAQRSQRVAAVTITDKHQAFLATLHYTLDTVLPDGQEIDLSEKIGLSYGGSSREVTTATHPQLKEVLERAAVAVDDPLLGFDFITPDVAADPGTVKWGIIECNSVPFINLHHDPLYGEPVNVAGILFDYLERELNWKK